jgi:8-oxo-dGTP pyrophosphatase MutT (NUDIX family)
MTDLTIEQQERVRRAQSSPRAPLAKVTVATVLFREKSDGTHEILTQLRSVPDPNYDPLYNMTREAVAESLQPKEHMLAAARRGIEEETGVSASGIIFYGADFKEIQAPPEFFSTRAEDLYVFTEPLMVTLTINGPQPWISVGFAGQVPSDWSPDMSKADGEALSPQWSTTADLLAELQAHPEKFFGLTYQLLLKVATELD